VWVKLDTGTGYSPQGGSTGIDTYYRLDDLPYLEVRGPAPTTSLYYISCEASASATAYLAPGYATQADAVAALDTFVATFDAGGLVSP